MRNLPLYQKTVPKSCGPWDILHVKIISLVDLTYKSGGPKIVAFSSTNEEQKDMKKREKH